MKLTKEEYGIVVQALLERIDKLRKIIREGGVGGKVNDLLEKECNECYEICKKIEHE